MKKVKNFARFYACLKHVQTADKEDTKLDLVHQFTKGRTTSLREMFCHEYDAMCNSIDPKMQQNLQEKSEIKSARSAVLRKLQQLGVDTTDWNKVDTFCFNNRIAGKKFYELSIDELKALIPKLIAISRKPKPRKANPVITDSNLNYMLSNMPTHQLPS